MQKPVEILLIEDSPADVELARVAFHDAKIVNNLHVVSTAEHALHFLKREEPFVDAPKPDLIFLDLGLPTVPGTDVLKAVRQSPELASIPIVVLTGNDAPETIDEAYRLQASCFLTKPVDLQLIFEVISNLDGFFVQIGRESPPDA